MDCCRVDRDACRQDMEFGERHTPKVPLNNSIDHHAVMRGVMPRVRRCSLLTFNIKARRASKRSCR